MTTCECCGQPVDGPGPDLCRACTELLESEQGKAAAEPTK